jgi:hypothetical protein
MERMWRHITVVATLLMAMAATTGAGAAVTFSFGLWGDLPYARSNDEPKMKPLIDDMNASDIAFSIYDGDLKDGSSKCTDDVFERSIAMFNAFRKPAIYVPGDNEWTDCHRLNNGGYDNLERLAYLRHVMFAKPQSFGAETMMLTHQALPGEKYAENVRFEYGSIVFVGLNIPGSNNNRVHDDKECTNKSARTSAQCAADNKEYEERDAADIAWVHEAFERARSTRAPGIVLVFQADPGFDLPETEDVNERKNPAFDGYTNFLDKLVQEARSYAGQVLIVHGDTHFFKVDKPLIDQAHPVPNITRLETFGSPNASWVRVDVDPTSRDVFIIRQMIVSAR